MLLRAGMDRLSSLHSALNHAIMKWFILKSSQWHVENVCAIFCLFSRHSSVFEMHKMIKVFVISSLLHRFSNSSTKQNVEKNYLISSNDNNNEKAYISAFQNKKNAIQKWTSPMIVQFRRKVNKYSDITETYDHSKSNLFN